MPILSNPFRRSFAGLLGLALLAALWTTGLSRVSDKSTAISLLTDAGTQLVNPLLVSNGTGITQSSYLQLEKQATAHPNQPVQILFIKPQILGKDIAGKSYTQGLQVIFGKVAQAYYSGGPGAAFSLPSQLQSALSSYTPFVQSKTPLPGLPQSPLPQLPSFGTQIYTYMGLSPATLTTDGHNGVTTLSLWLWVASGALGIVLAAFGSGWGRLRTVSWSVFHSAWHITLLFIIASFLVSSHSTQAAPYRGVLGLVGGAFFPVYAIATLAGLCGVVVCFVATHLPQQREKAAPEAAAPVPAGHPRAESSAYSPGYPSAAISYPQQGYPSAGAPPYMEPGQGQYAASPPLYPYRPQSPYPESGPSMPTMPDDGPTTRQP